MEEEQLFQAPNWPNLTRKDPDMARKEKLYEKY